MTLNEHGGSLIELILAMTILLIITLGVLSGFTQVDRSLERMLIQAQAQQALQQAATELLHLSGDSPRLEPGPLSGLSDITSPQHTTDAEGDPWVIAVGTRRFSVAYSVVQDMGFEDLLRVRLYASEVNTPRNLKTAAIHDISRRGF